MSVPTETPLILESFLSFFCGEFEGMVLAMTVGTFELRD